MKYSRRVRQQAARSSSLPVREEIRVLEASAEPCTNRSGYGWLWLAAVLGLTMLLASGNASAATEETANGCPATFNHKMKQLHSSKVLDLCEVSAGKPVLLINTASHCGFTKQFGDLQAIHDKYKDKGLVVIGVASNSFNQEAKTEEEAARICKKNFGVSFTMLAPVPVRGDEAHPLFREVAAQSVTPKWNFYKYLLNADGQVVESWSSITVPDDEDLLQVL